MNMQQVQELLLQSLQHELGGVEVYSTAITCAVNRELRAEWQKYLDETRRHVAALQEVCQAFSIDQASETPGRGVVRHIGRALVEAMELALSAGNPAAAELVACECVVLAETKDHLDWELLGKCAENLEGAGAEALQRAQDEIEDQEDEHLYHSRGWCRELWLQSLGLSALLPPPEERQHVKTAVGAAKAEMAAEKLR